MQKDVLIVYVNSEGPDHTAQMRSLVWAFAVLVQNNLL